MSNYPPGVSELPGDRFKEYVFEVHGEIIVLAESEEDAKERLREDAREYLHEAYSNGELDVQ